MRKYEGGCTYNALEVEEKEQEKLERSHCKAGFIVTPLSDILRSNLGCQIRSSRLRPPGAHGLRA